MPRHSPKAAHMEEKPAVKSEAKNGDPTPPSAAEISSAGAPVAQSPSSSDQPYAESGGKSEVKPFRLGNGEIIGIKLKASSRA